MGSTIFASIVIAVLLVAAGLFGGYLQYTSIANDCRTFGAFAPAGVIFDCKERK